MITSSQIPSVTIPNFTKYLYSTYPIYYHNPHRNPKNARGFCTSTSKAQKERKKGKKTPSDPTPRSETDAARRLTNTDHLRSARLASWFIPIDIPQILRYRPSSSEGPVRSPSRSSLQSGAGGRRSLKGLKGTDAIQPCRHAAMQTCSHAAISPLQKKKKTPSSRQPLLNRTPFFSERA